MISKHNIETYEKLALGASFFLEESFNYLDSALKSEFASILFSKQLENLEPNKEDEEIFKNLNLPETPIGLLQSSLPEVISEKTSKIMSDAWDDAQVQAKKGKYKFDIDYKVNSIEILGHLNNLGFFMETIINRHLLFLNQSKIINDSSYSKISISRIMERIKYIFEGELNNNKVHLNEVQKLFRLRNKTVHFTPDNAKLLNPRISELIKIWAHCANLVKKLELKENFNEENFSERIIQYSFAIQNKWN